MSFFLSFSLSLPLIAWSTETHLAHSPARASKTLSRRHPVPSPHLERAPSAFVRDTSSVSRTLLAFCINQGVSASFSLSLSYSRLQTARFQSIKGPQQLSKYSNHNPFMIPLTVLKTYLSKQTWHPQLHYKHEQVSSPHGLELNGLNTKFLPKNHQCTNTFLPPSPLFFNFLFAEHIHNVQEYYDKQPITWS